MIYLKHAIHMKDFHTVIQGYFGFIGNFDHLRPLKAILIWQWYIAL